MMEIPNCSILYIYNPGYPIYIPKFMVMDDSHFSAKVFLPGVVQHSLGITTAAQSHDISWLQFQREVEVVDGTYRDSGRCWVLTKG
jgi:hypothetical protein